MKAINRFTLIAFVGAVSACSGVPMSVREFAASLPARADGQYAPLDGVIKKQLVLMDALLPCAIDVADRKSADESPACRCSKSSSADWTADCKAWLGSHVPGADGPRTGSSPAAGGN